jgi:hypothetical protein
MLTAKQSMFILKVPIFKTQNICENVYSLAGTRDMAFLKWKSAECLIVQRHSQKLIGFQGIREIQIFSDHCYVCHFSYHPTS